MSAPQSTPSQPQAPSDAQPDTVLEPGQEPGVLESGVLESVVLVAAPGRADALVAAVQQALPLFQNSPGCRSMVLRRQVEDADQFRLDVQWDHLDDHLVGFRESDAFPQWRALVTPNLAQPPAATHTRLVTQLF